MINENIKKAQQTQFFIRKEKDQKRREKVMKIIRRFISLLKDKV